MRHSDTQPVGIRSGSMTTGNSHLVEQRALRTGTRRAPTAPGRVHFRWRWPAVSGFRHLACVLILVILPLGCAGAGHEQPPTAQPEATTLTAAQTMDSLRLEIQELVGQAQASSVDNCRAIPFGAKPCGGPWTYLVFSTEKTDSAGLADLVGRYNAIEARLNREEGRISDCQFVTPPSLRLVDGRCRAAGQHRLTGAYFGFPQGLPRTWQPGRDVPRN